MTQLTWDEVGDRVFEVGVSKGVLYKEDKTGIPWNGLISVEENTDNSIESVYYDGTKFSNILTLGEFAGTIRAFTCPDEFLFYEGTIEDQFGFYISNQEPSQFGLCYQTKIGDDVSGLNRGYKIHILYNLTALPSGRSYESINDELEPIELEWEVTSIPEEIENFRPTSHVIIDSRKVDPYMLIDLESILYGSETTDPYLPTLKALSTFLRTWARLLISTDGHGIWTAYARDEGVITMLDGTTFEIDSDTATFIDADSYTISSSAKDEGDIWLP